MRDGVREQCKSKTAISATPLQSKTKMKWERGRSPGWAAFDLKQQEKQGPKPEFFSDPYPPVSNNITSMPPLKELVTSNSSSAKSFSSVAKPSIDSSILTSTRSNFGKQKLVANCSSNLVNVVQTEDIVITDFEKLKQLHNWADDSLIEDIVVAVSYDFYEACTLLHAMVSSGSTEQNKTTNLAENRALGDSIGDTQTEQPHKSFSTEKMTDLVGLSVALEECLFNQKIDETGKGIAKAKLSESTEAVKLISRSLISAPVEPEWEEDDIYLCHRKDAIRATRSAAQHSRAASNAYLRGDHYSAQQLSLKAHGEWMAAEKLNFKAAQEILSIRNSDNDVWKLDLHGLHSSEAVNALQKHLWRIETQIPLNRSVPSNRIVNPKADSPVESGSFWGVELRTEKEQAMPSQRPSILQVITGTGNHSHGQASLPAAVRSYLIENGYRFDETRPGVIAVRPKFRQY